MKTWIKMYTESLHDRKLWKLKPIEQLTFWYLCTLAGIEDRGGQLPPMDDIELELRMPLQLKRAELDRIITTLIGAGLITSDPETGTISVTNFEKRQMSSQTEAEKKALYRDRKRTANGQTSDECLTTESDTEEDTVRTSVRTPVHEKSTLEEEVEEEVEEEEELKERDREKETRALKTASKHKHGQFGHVLLTDAEYGKLCKRFGPSTDSKIQNLDDYLQNNRKKHYDDHYLTLLKWAEKDDKTAHQPARQEPAKRESWVELAERMQSQKNAVIAEADAITGFGGAA